MNGDVDLTGAQGVFQFLSEQTFAADFGQGLIENLVAGRLNQTDRAGEVRPGGGETGADPIGLPASQSRSPCSDDECCAVSGYHKSSCSDQRDDGWQQR